MFRIARTLMLGGLSGKALGVARELLTAALFGTGPVAAAYRLAQAAFLIPLHGFLSDAFSAGFTPAYARSLKHDGTQARALFAGMHALVLVISAIVAAAMAMFAAHWVQVLAPGFDAETAALATQMVVLLSFTMPCYALTGLYAAEELASGGARIASARASVQSIGLIIGTLMAWWSGNALWIAGGFLAAYLALALGGFVATQARGLPAWPRTGEWARVWPQLVPVWRAVRVLLLVPVLLQVHSVVERRVASIVSPGAVAALDYVRFLADTAVLLLAVPIGLAALGTVPVLSEAKFRELATRSARMLLYAGVPLSLVLVLHAERVVTLVFGRGAFGPESVALTTTILQTLALGLWAQILGYAGAKFLSARNRNVTLIGIYAVAVGCNVALNLALYPILGVAALGLGAAANSLLFGTLILHSLGCLRALKRDLVTLALAALGYVMLWRLAPETAHHWIALLGFACYWGLVAIGVPRCRGVLHDAWLSMRTA